MKVLLFVFCCVIASNSLDQKFVSHLMQKVLSFGPECIRESSATKDDIESLLIHHKIPESHGGRCLLFCFHKHLNLQYENGTLDKAGATKTWEPLKEDDLEMHDKVLNIFLACTDKVATDDDPCTYAANLDQCVITDGKALGLDQLFVGV